MKTFLQYGAGNIGRGFIGPVFSLGGYKVVFVDIDQDIIDTLNQNGRYPVTIVSNTSSRELWVENVRGIDGRKTQTVAEAIARCDIMAVSVGVKVLPIIAPVIAEGIKQRFLRGDVDALDILICENLIDADKFLRTIIAEHLDAAQQDYFSRKVGLVETSIGRMVPVVTPEQRKENILRVYVEEYGELPVDREAFKGEVPGIPHLFPYSPFEFFIKRKLYVHNMGHSLCAYLGHLEGYERIFQCVANPVIKIIVHRAMLESAAALMHRFDVDPTALLDHISHLLSRFANEALGDTVMRVGNDVRRKVSPFDRFAGALQLCSQEGIPSFYIPAGIASAFVFENPQDPGIAQIHQAIEEDGLNQVLSEVCGIPPDSEYASVIEEYYRYLKKRGDLTGLFGMIEESHRQSLFSRKII